MSPLAWTWHRGGADIAARLRGTQQRPPCRSAALAHAGYVAPGWMRCAVPDPVVMAVELRRLRFVTPAVAR